MLVQVDMYLSPQLTLPPTKTSQDGLYPRQEEATTIKGDQIETRLSTLDPDSDLKLPRKTEQVKNVILAPVIGHRL